MLHLEGIQELLCLYPLWLFRGVFPCRDEVTPMCPYSGVQANGRSGSPCVPLFVGILSLTPVALGACSQRPTLCNGYSLPPPVIEHREGSRCGQVPVTKEEEDKLALHVGSELSQGNWGGGTRHPQSFR